MSHTPVSLEIAGWTAGASTILGVLVLLGLDAPERHFVAVMAGLAWVILALVLQVAAREVRAILEEQRVFGARVAPRPGLPAQRRASLLVIAGTGGALALAVGWQAVMATAAAPAPTSPTGPWLPAIAAAAALASVLHALAWMGALAWWGRAHVLWLAGLCAALSALLALGWEGVQGWAAQAPWVAVPALAGAAWVAWRAHRNLWAGKPPPKQERALSPRVWMGDRAAWFKAGFARIDPVAVPFAAILPHQMLPSLDHDLMDGPLFVSWGSEFDLASVGRLALLACGMCLYLRTDALHWRWLLAPSGRSRSSLAWDVVLRSWLAAAVALLLLAGMFAPFAVLGGGTLGDEHPGVLAWLGEMVRRFGPTLLCELLLATALATCVRPLVSSSLAAGLVWLVAALVAFAGVAVARNFYGVDTLPGWPREAAHHLGVLALAAAVTGLAGLGWKRVDLRQMLGPRPAANAWEFGSWPPRLTRKPAASPTRRSS
jgi:hypothetical protein